MHANHQDNQYNYRVHVWVYFRCVLIGFGIAGIIFMAVNALLSGKFFLVFSPIFMMYSLILSKHIRAYDHCCWVQDYVHHQAFRIPSNSYWKGNLQYLVKFYLKLSLASSVFYFFACGSNNGVVGWIMGIIMFAMGILYFILHCCGGSEYNKEIKEQMMWYV